MLSLQEQASDVRCSSSLPYSVSSNPQKVYLLCEVVSCPLRYGSQPFALKVLGFITKTKAFGHWLWPRFGVFMYSTWQTQIISLLAWAGNVCGGSSRWFPNSVRVYVHLAVDRGFLSTIRCNWYRSSLCVKPLIMKPALYCLLYSRDDSVVHWSGAGTR